eukprot:scaffold29_cov251-Pinguiococcus_pyrenoidosus.AAC.5
MDEGDKLEIDVNVHRAPEASGAYQIHLCRTVEESRRGTQAGRWARITASHGPAGRLLACLAAAGPDGRPPKRREKRLRSWCTRAEVHLICAKRSPPAVVS